MKRRLLVASNINRRLQSYNVIREGYKENLNAYKIAKTDRLFIDCYDDLN